MNNNLSLAKIISGLSKALNLARQALPLYKEIKPVLEKSTNLLANLNNSNTKKSNTSINSDTKKNETKEISSSSNPKFFQ